MPMTTSLIRFIGCCLPVPDILSFIRISPFLLSSAFQSRWFRTPRSLETQRQGGKEKDRESTPHVTGKYLGCFALACGLCCPLQAQEPTTNVYAGLSREAAQAKFERAIVEERRQQRQILEQTRGDLVRLLALEQVDKKSREVLEQVVKRLSSSRDYLMTLEFVLQARGQLNDVTRIAYDLATGPMSSQWALYQQCKRDYQPTVGKSLAQRWPNLSLESKRSELTDYFVLVDQRPAWLMRGSPINIFELVPKAAQQPINQYLAEKRDLIRSAHDQLQPKLNETLRLAHAASLDPHGSDDERHAARAIAQILEAPYARGLRGVPLCQPTDKLPTKLRSQVHALLEEYLQEIKVITPTHNKLLSDLNTRLESGQRDRLENLKLDEQMAVDIYLAQITHLIQPTRVLASRSARSRFYENALLLDLSKSNGVLAYRVEYLIDGVSQWIDTSQLQTFETNLARSDAQPAVPANKPDEQPIDSPGQVVTDLTDFDSGQAYAYCPAGWKPVIVVDESALGVVIRWHGAADPIEYTFPREQLRIVPTKP